MSPKSFGVYQLASLSLSGGVAGNESVGGSDVPGSVTVTLTERFEIESLSSVWLPFILASRGSGIDFG